MIGRLRPSFRARIRWKILGPYLVLALLLAALATFLVTRVVSGSLEERFTNQLVEAGRVAGDNVVRTERGHLEIVRTVTFTEGIEEAVLNADHADLERIVLPIAANNAAEAVYILDQTGAPLYAAALTDLTQLTYSPIPEAAARLATTTVAPSALTGEVGDRGDKFAAIVETASGPQLVTAGPIYAGDEIIGVVAISSSIGSLLASIKQQTFSDVTVYADDGVVLASTFVIDDDSPIAAANPSVATPEGSGLRDSQILAGRPYQFLYAPMYVRGEAIGALSVALPTTFVTSAGQTTRTQMATLFGLATLAVLLVGLALARVITAPLNRLVRAAGAVTAGDLTARSGVTGRDEIGTLATTFDSMTERLQRQHLGTIRAMVSAIDARDPYTRGHSVRVGHLSVELGHGFGLSEGELQHLQIGGYLHDIGKIGVRDSVLLKPGQLTAEERAMIEEHPRVGLEILESVLLPDEVLAVVGQHHERLDGTGYPFALSADELTLFPRIAAVADVYDALTTDRPYRDGMSINQSLKILVREAESGMLDQDVVAAMTRVAGRWEERIHDDPALKGLDSVARLHLRGDGDLHDTPPAHQHPHPHPPGHHAA